MKTSVAAALAGLAMASTPTLGADLFGTAPPPMTFPASESPLTEVGANWYLRGDIGYEFDNEPTVVPTAGLIPAILTDPLPARATSTLPRQRFEQRRRDAREQSEQRRAQFRRRRRLPRQQLPAARSHLHVFARPEPVLRQQRPLPGRHRRRCRTKWAARPSRSAIFGRQSTAPATSTAPRPTIRRSPAPISISATSGASRRTSAPAAASTPTRFRARRISSSTRTAARSAATPPRAARPTFGSSRPV